jgi:TrmH family RNA methyltransferase
MPGDRCASAGLVITSPANPQIKRLVALRRRRIREAAAVTLVEGREELGLALSAGVRPVVLYYCPDLIGGGPRSLVGQAEGLGADVVQVSRPVFEKIAYRESPDGWLAVVPAVRSGLAALEVGEQPLILVCDRVEKPGNLGAMLRTADAAGVTAVIATDPVTDWGNPNVIRASKGTVFSVPVASASTAEVMRWLAEHALKVVATAPGPGVELIDADLTGAIAIAVGSESCGLSAEWLARADLLVHIPMFGYADSLNVATSAAIVTYEAVRQRMQRRRRPIRGQV